MIEFGLLPYGTVCPLIINFACCLQMEKGSEAEQTECPITGQAASTDIYSERTNKYYAKHIQARKTEI